MCGLTPSLFQAHIRLQRRPELIYFDGMQEETSNQLILIKKKKSCFIFLGRDLKCILCPEQNRIIWGQIQQNSKLNVRTHFEFYKTGKEAQNWTSHTQYLKAVTEKMNYVRKSSDFLAIPTQTCSPQRPRNMHS